MEGGGKRLVYPRFSVPAAATFRLCQGFYPVRHLSKSEDMMHKPLERWEALARLAANETDPKRLLVIVREVTKLLEEKQERLNAMRRAPTKSQAKTVARIGGN